MAIVVNRPQNATSPAQVHAMKRHTDKLMVVVLIATTTFILQAIADNTEVIGKVVSVSDGDTINVLDPANNQIEVRLSGIDAPERGQSYANVSRVNLARMVAGKEVRVETTKTDPHGRDVGKVWVQPSDCPACGKTLDANLAQITAGMAWWYRYYAEEQSPEDRGRYESAEDEARARKWGLWADPNPINPYEWRKADR